VGSGWPPLRDHLNRASPALADRLLNAEPLFNRPLAVVCPDGGYLHDASTPTVFRVGDRLAHIPPFTGDGLAIAVASGALPSNTTFGRGSPPDSLPAGRPVLR